MARPLTSLLFASLALGAMAGSLSAQQIEMHAYGIRGGISLEDDLTQVLVGGHADLSGLAPNVRLVPLFTVGAGDDALTLLFAGEAHYLFPLEDRSQRYQPYAGGGIGLHHIARDDPGDDAVDLDNDDTDIALLVTGGVEVPVQRWWGWFAEGRFVIQDDTIFRLEAGVNWLY